MVEHSDFVVVDKKNNGDITRSILLQVIADQEQSAEPILTQEFMLNVIRAYGTSAQTSICGHLEQTLRYFISQQPQALREHGAPIERARPPEESYNPTPLRDTKRLTR